MEAAFITVPPSTASLAPAKASSFIAAKRPVSRVAGVDLLGRRRSVPPAGEQSCVRTTRVQPKAVQSIDFYNAQEGVGRDDVDIVLPDDVIYKSLRRKAEYMCFHTALELVKEMAGNGIRSPAALTPSPSLSPRKSPSTSRFRLCARVCVLASTQAEPLCPACTTLLEARRTNSLAKYSICLLPIATPT